MKCMPRYMLTRLPNCPKTVKADKKKKNRPELNLVNTKAVY